MSRPSRFQVLTTLVIATIFGAHSPSAQELGPPGKTTGEKPATKKNHPATTARHRFLQWKQKTKRKPAREAQSQAKIIGGTVAPPGAYPWMAALATKGDPDLFNAQFCGGSLIHPYWVITAAHCMEGESPDSVEVVLGAHDLENPVNIQRLGVAEIIIHPEFRSNTFDADLALVRLKSPALPQFTPIPLIDDPSLAAPGVLSRLLGWGDTSGFQTFSTLLRQVDVPIVSLAVANATAAYSGSLTGYMLPAGFEAGGRDSCQGDSGGPLVVPAPGVPGAWMLAGLVSFAEGCAVADAYGINTRVSAFRPFILSHLYPSYAAWESSQGVLGEWRDGDGDQRNNFGEFAFQSNPNLADQPSQEVVFYESGGQSYPASRFRKPVDSREVAYALESSSGLDNWSSSELDGKLVDLTPIAEDPSAVLATAPSTESLTSAAGFLRLAARPSFAYISGVRDLSCPGYADGSLTAEDDPHPTLANRLARTYRLNDPEGGVALRITARSAEFDVLLELLDASDGTVLTTSATDRAGGSTGLDEQIDLVPATGRSYLVRLSSENNGGTGSYQLGVFKPGAYEALPGIAVPSTTTGSLLTSSPLDPIWEPSRFYSRDYRLVGSEDSPLVANLTSSTLDSYLEIISAETGLLLADDDDSGTGVSGLDALLNFTPTPGVAYIVRVTTAVENQTGAFILNLSESSPPSPATPIGVPQSVQGVLTTTDERDLPEYPGAFKDDYLLTGVSPGQTVTVFMSSSQIDCYLFLVNAATGAIVDFDDDGGGGLNSRLVVTIPPGVSYLIRATSAFDGEVGSYLLTTSG